MQAAGSRLAVLADRLAELFPPGVVVHGGPVAGMELVPLFPEEAAAVNGACVERRRLYQAGRAHAHAALARLGAPVGPLPRRPDGAPDWPAGFVGAISHCADFCVAAAARTGDFAVLGLDVEIVTPLSDTVVKLITGAPERAWLNTQPASERHRSLVLIFSAKESLFKGLYARAGRAIGFDEAEIEPRADGTFHVRLAPALARMADGTASLNGRYLMAEGHVLTALAWSGLGGGPGL